MCVTCCSTYLFQNCVACIQKYTHIYTYTHAVRATASITRNHLTFLLLLSRALFETHTRTRETETETERGKWYGVRTYVHPLRVPFAARQPVHQHDIHLQIHERYVLARAPNIPAPTRGRSAAPVLPRVQLRASSPPSILCVCSSTQIREKPSHREREAEKQRSRELLLDVYYMEGTFVSLSHSSISCCCTAMSSSLSMSFASKDGGASSCNDCCSDVISLRTVRPC